MTAFDVDVAIVGGGPAGSSLALHLAALGARMERVVVLDKAKHPREKPCAGAVSAWGLAALEAVGAPLAVPNVRIGRIGVVAAGVTGASSPGDLGAVIRRSEYDADLLARAGARGAEVRDGEGLVALAAIGGGWRLTTTRGTLTARFVAACDGAGSTVRKLLRVREAARKGHLYVLETEVRASDAERLAGGTCVFDLRASDRGVQGYYWDFPTVMDGAPAVSRGIYDANMDDRDRPARHKEVLARFLAERGIDAARARLKPFATRPFVPGAPLAAAGVLLVGEAAGIDATTGEGIAQAILMAGIAARHVARGLTRGALDAREYAREVTAARVGRHLLQSAWLARRVYGPRGATWRRFLAGEAAARDAGALWYAGVPLEAKTKARLAFRLTRELLTDGVAPARRRAPGAGQNDMS